MADSASVSAAYAFTCTPTEVVATCPAAASSGTGASIVHDQFNSSGTLTSATTPPVTKVAAFDLALSDGAATIDLTSLTGTNGATITGDGLKVQLILINALAANANVLSFTEGASDGYALMGASFLFALQPGQKLAFYGNDATPDIADADSEIDVTGTGSQGAEIIIVMG